MTSQERKKTCEEYLNRRERRKGGNDHSSEVRRAEPEVMNAQYLSVEKIRITLYIDCIRQERSSLVSIENKIMDTQKIQTGMF
jgi:hypothetical protein